MRCTAVTGLRYILGKKCLLSATISTSQENGFRTIRIFQSNCRIRDLKPLSRRCCFIVPVENAFKHGVRSGKSSFIHIVLKENDGRIICKVENSCYPDYDSRESRDTGIGLENLHRRLDILYDGHYTFQYGVTDNEKYYSYLEIETM